MNEFQAVNEIINSAVKDSSYITVLISSCVFIAYTLIIKVVDLFKAKSRNKPLLDMASAIKEISQNVVKLNQVLDKTIQDAEVKEIGRINNVVSIALNSFKSSVIDKCIDIIIHNNIDLNKEDITQNIYKTINTEYYKLYSILLAYEYNSINVSTKIREEWIEEITNECISIIYDGDDALSRIRQLNNKLTLLSDAYSIYIKNKVFNH